MTHPTAKPKTHLLLLILLFAIPILLATWMYHRHQLFGGTPINHGVLIKPPLAAKQLELSANHTWTLLLFQPQSCHTACQKRLFDLGQIQKASGKNQKRITRILLTNTSNPSLIMTIEQRYPNLQIQRHAFPALNKLSKRNATLAFANQPGTTFIMDPNGNIMMAYHPKTPAMDIFKDLKHLLRLSQIG